MPRSLASRTLPKPVVDGVLRTIEPHFRIRSNGTGACSAKTRKERRQFYLLMVAELWGLGFRIQKLDSLSSRHVTALMGHWHKKGIVAGTLHTRLSMLNVLCLWLGKRNVVRNILSCLPEEAVRRHTVAKASKAWDAKAVDPLEVIGRAKKIDARLAAMLAMQHHFGLRVKESIELRPANAVVDGGLTLEIHEGTKGGRVRRVPVRSVDQQEAIAWARGVAASGNTKRLRWPGLTFRQAQARFYYYLRSRLGISRFSAGVTAHGLRHGYAQRSYLEETGGLACPVNGGAPGAISRELHHAASITVSHALGHGRVDVTTSYYGSYGHALRDVRANAACSAKASGEAPPQSPPAGQDERDGHPSRPQDMQRGMLFGRSGTGYRFF
jgi:integrase